MTLFPQSAVLTTAPIHSIEQFETATTVEQPKFFKNLFNRFSQDQPQQLIPFFLVRPLQLQLQLLCLKMNVELHRRRRRQNTTFQETSMTSPTTTMIVCFFGVMILANLPVRPKKHLCRAVTQNSSWSLSYKRNKLRHCIKKYTLVPKFLEHCWSVTNLNASTVKVHS